MRKGLVIPAQKGEFKMKKILLLALVMMFTFASLGMCAEDIKIMDLKVLEMPPQAKRGVAFCIFENVSGKDIYLTKVESSISKKAEIHQHIKENGQNKMVPMKKLKIPAKSQYALEKGKDHIMLIDLMKPVKSSETVKLIFTFSNKQVIEKEVKVTPRDFSKKDKKKN